MQISGNAGQAYIDSTVTTDQQTSSGAQYITVDPNQSSCYELSSHMVRNTMTGTSSLDAVFSGYVGFYDPKATCDHIYMSKALNCALVFES